MRILIDMAETTLADFARHLRIAPALAEEWKREGRITETDDCFIYAHGEAGATLSKKPTLSVCLRCGAQSWPGYKLICIC